MADVWEEHFDNEAPKDLPPDFGEEFEEEPLREEVVELLHLGRLSSSVEIRGHTIRISTLTVGEELLVAILARDYIDTQDANKAYATALVAAAITSVNGKPLAAPLGPNTTKREVLERKYEYVLSHWYWPVVRVIYDE